MESSSGCSVWFGHRHRGHPEDTGGGFSERGEDFYPAIREDIQLATREDFFMAMDTATAGHQGQQPESNAGHLRIPEVFVHPFRSFSYTDSGGFRTPLRGPGSIRV